LKEDDPVTYKAEAAGKCTKAAGANGEEAAATVANKEEC